MSAPSRLLLLVCTLLGLAVLAIPETARTGETGADAPEPVATGAVGESGPACQLVHRVAGDARRKAVLRHVRSSLCPNTGAVALLVVNGEPRVHGTLTAPESSIAVDVRPGDRVIAVVHTIPLFNGIECVRHGALHVALEVGAP